MADDNGRKLVFHLTGAFAEFELTMIRPRIKAGLKRAIAQGVKLGRPKIDSATERKVRKQLAKGVGILKVATSLGLGTGTVQLLLEGTNPFFVFVAEPLGGPVGGLFGFKFSSRRRPRKFGQKRFLAVRRS